MRQGQQQLNNPFLDSSSPHDDFQKDQLFKQFQAVFSEFCSQNSRQASQNHRNEEGGYSIPSASPGEGARFASQNSLLKSSMKQSRISFGQDSIVPAGRQSPSQVTFRDAPNQIGYTNDLMMETFNKASRALQESATLNNKIKQTIESQKDEDKEDDDEEEEIQVMQFLRYGDIICLNFFHSFPGQDKEEETDENLNERESDEHEANHDKVNVEIVSDNSFDDDTTRNNRRTANPSQFKRSLPKARGSPPQREAKADNFYKGVLWSDGVSSKNLSIIPKVPKKSKGQNRASLIMAHDDFNGLNGSQQVGKCLFRIETVQDCEKAQLYQELEQKIQNLEDQIDNSNDSKQKEQLVNQKETLAARMDKMKQVLDEEIRNNEYDLQMNLGKKVTYGERVQLKHQFSDLYLTINKKSVAKENGCVSMTLSEASFNGQFTLLPSLKTKELGQPVSYLDFFCMQYFDADHLLDRYQFYLHVSAGGLQNIVEEGQIFEVNGCNEPTSFKAKLFVDYDRLQKDQELVYSGNSIKLFHQDVGGHLTVSEKIVDDYIIDYPDFLQKERVELFKEVPDDAPLDTNQDNFSLFSARRFNQDETNSEGSEDDGKRVYIERSQDELFESDSHWEIHKFKPFKGGPIEWDDKCRIKHVGSGKFLATSKESGVKGPQMYLKDFPDMEDTVFIIRRENYLLSHKDRKEPVKDEDYVLIESFHKTFVKSQEFVETLDDQSFFEKQNSSVKGEINQGQNGTPSAKLHRQSLKNLKSQSFTENDKTAIFARINSQLKEDELKEPETSGTQVPVLSGEFMKHEIARMVFKIQRVQQHEALLSQQGCSFFEFFARSFNYLVRWAIATPDEKRIEDYSRDKSLHFNDVQQAIAKEDDLFNKAEEIFDALKYLQSILLKAQEESIDIFIKTQNYFAQQGILQIIIMMIELIFFRTVQPKDRAKPFKKLSAFEVQNTDSVPSKNRPQLIDESAKDEEVFQIANDHLHEAQDMLLRTIYLLIKHNVVNSSVVTAYDDVFFIQLKYQDIRVLTSIFKETYKRAQQILGEENSQGSSSSQGGIDLSERHPSGSSRSLAAPQLTQGGSKFQSQVHNPTSSKFLSVSRFQSQMGQQTSDNQEFTKVTSSLKQIQNSQQYDIKINRWAKLLDRISLKNAKDETMAYQMLYLQVLTMICVTPSGQGIYKYQMQTLKAIFIENQSLYSGTLSAQKSPVPKLNQQLLQEKALQLKKKIPLKLAVDKATNKILVKLYTGNQVIDGKPEFEVSNPLLKIHRGVSSFDESFESCYCYLDLEELSQDYDKFFPYIDYIIQVIKLYTNLCKSRNQLGMKCINEIGFTYQNIITKVSKSVKICDLVKATFIDLARVLFIDSDSFLYNYSSINRLYPWVMVKQTNSDSSAPLILQKAQSSGNLNQPKENKPILDQEVNIMTHRDLYLNETKLLAAKEQEYWLQKETLGKSRPDGFKYDTFLFYNPSQVGSSQDEAETSIEDQAKDLREFILKEFNKFPNLEKQNTFNSNNKDLQDFKPERSNNQNEKLDMTLKLYVSLLELATSLIRAQHVDYQFIQTMIRVAATVFIKYDIQRFNDRLNYEDQASSGVSADGKPRAKINKKVASTMEDFQRRLEVQNQYLEQQKSNEEMTKDYQAFRAKYKIVEDIKKAETMNLLRNKIQMLEIKTLRMLESICHYRLDTQVLFLVKYFKTLLQSDRSRQEIQEELQKLKTGKLEGDSNGGLLFQLEKIFSLFQFSNETSSQRKDQLRSTLNTVFGEAMGSDVKDSSKLFELYKQSIKDIEHLKTDIPAPDSSFTQLSKFFCCGSQRKNDEKQGPQAESELQFVLFKLLLFSVFKKTQNSQIRDEAAKVLVINFQQQSLLLDEISKIDILVSYQDQEDYLLARLRVLHVQYHVNQIVHLYNYEIIKQNKFKVISHLRALSDLLKQLIIQIQNSTDRQSRTQSFLRHLNTHQILITQFLMQIDTQKIMEDSMRDDFLECFKSISYYLLAFSFNNAKNQKSLLSHLYFLLNLMDLDEEYGKTNQNLIASILWRNKNTEEGQIFMHFILKKIGVSKFFNSRILKLLNLMTFDSLNNQNIILKHLVQKPEFIAALRLKDDNQGSLKQLMNKILLQEKEPFGKADLSMQANSILKLREYAKFKVKEEYKDRAKAPVWEKLQMHLICIEILANCANSHYGILSARKQMSPQLILQILSSLEYPLLMKKAYMRLLYQAYISDYGDDLSTIDLNTPSLIQVIHSTLDILNEKTQLIKNCNSTFKLLDIHEDLNQTTVNDIDQQQLRVSPSQEEEAAYEDQSFGIFADDQTKKTTSSRTLLSGTPKKQSMRDQQEKNQLLLIREVLQLYELMRFFTLFKQRQNRKDGYLHFSGDFFRSIIISKQDFQSPLTSVLQRYSDFLKDLSLQVHYLHENLSRKLLELRQIKDAKLRPDNHTLENFKMFQEHLVFVSEALQMTKYIPRYFYAGNFFLFKAQRQFSSSKLRDKLLKDNSELFEEDSQDLQLTGQMNNSEMAQVFQRVQGVLDRVRQHLVSQNLKISNFAKDLVSNQRQLLGQNIMNEISKQQSFSKAQGSSEGRAEDFERRRESSLLGQDHERSQSRDSNQSSKALQEKQNPKMSLLCCNSYNDGEDQNKNSKPSEQTQGQKLVSEKKLNKFLREICSDLSMQDAEDVVREIQTQALKIQSQQKEEKQNLYLHFGRGMRSVLERIKQDDRLTLPFSSFFNYDIKPIGNGDQSFESKSQFGQQLTQSSKSSPEKKAQPNYKQILKGSAKDSTKIQMTDLEIIFASKSDITLLPLNLQFKKEVSHKTQQEFLSKDYDLAYKCRQDFIWYTDLFNQFCKSSNFQDEMQNLISQITGMFNYCFESNKTQVIKDFINNMVDSFQSSEYKLYLMKILNLILEQYMESTVTHEKMDTLANKVIFSKRLHKIQLTMSECKILDLLLGLIKRDEKPEINNEAIKLLCSLLCESNNQIQVQFLTLLKNKRKEYNLLEFIKDRLIISTESLIKETVESLGQQSSIHFEEEKRSLDLEIKIARREQADLKKQATQMISQTSVKEERSGSRAMQERERKKDTKMKPQDVEQAGQHDQLINMLKLIQYFCDSCYQPFQNFLIDQDHVEAEDQAVQQTQSANLENKQKSTINILIEVANVFIRLTTKLEMVVFEDFRLYQTISQILDTLIDFLYGPCQQAQKLLCGWKKFMKSLNVYLIQDLGYFSGTTTLLQAKLSIFTKCTKLLLALIETESFDFKRAQLEEMVNELDIDKLKAKMIDIFTYKVGVDAKRERIYYSNKRCNHYYNPRKTGAYNLCMKDEFCQYGHYIKFDKKIIQSGFNIFIFLQNLNEFIPTLRELLNCDFQLKNQVIYTMNTQTFKPILDCHSTRNVIHHRVIARIDMEKYKKALELKAEQVMKEIDPRAAEQRASELQKLRTELQSLKEEQEKSKALLRERMEEEETVLCCSTWKTRHNQSGKQLNLGGTTQDFDLVSKSDYQKMIEEERKEKERKNLDLSYAYEQFRLDTAIRFYIQNVAQLEITYKGKLVKVMFQIPAYCHFMGETARKQLIYGSSDNSSQSDKLESFFKRINITKIEMKSLQQLERESTLKAFFSNSWGEFQAISLILIIIINILFLIYYQTDAATSSIYITNPYAEVIVQILTIIQALLSFIILASYFQKYHAVMFTQEVEKAYIVKKKWFTNFKGSLGYAFGQNTVKLNHGTVHELKAILSENSRITKQQRKRKRDILRYYIACFYFGLINDIRFLFNVLYFSASMVGIFKHFIFSFLLLDIIIKIPLLETVVQAIIQNKKQIFYTLLLLFMIIYIYSFIAFILFRSSYISSTFNPDDSGNLSLNSYCNSLVMCFTTTLNNGLRSGGGIGDVLEQLNQNEPLYWGRWVFDLTFFIFIIIIMLNLIFGIIIDAFAEMRDSRKKTEEEVREKCFICGTPRFNFEAQNKSFQDHVQREHNAFAYLYLVLYLLKKSFSDCSGVEKYVKQLAIAEDPKFFPINKSLSLNQAEVEDEKQKEA